MFDANSNKNLSQEKLDWVIAIVPIVDPTSPTVGPALLKSVLQANSFTCVTRDLNLDLFVKTYEDHDFLWHYNDRTFEEEKFFSKVESFINPIVKVWAKDLCKLEARFIGLSLLSMRSSVLCHRLCEEIRQINPNQKIVIGGPGTAQIAPTLMNGKLIDYYIRDEGELASLALSRGEFDSLGINDNGTAPQLSSKELELLPIPDYSDFQSNKYPILINSKHAFKEESLNFPLLRITASRGCVRRCSFCDVATLWPKFRKRSGKNIANEITVHNQKYGTMEYEFTDSLINGNISNLEELCVSLIESGSKNKQIQWRGQFICYPQDKFGSEHFKLMSQSGCKELWVGIESGSESVRLHMGKRFTNEDIKYCIDQSLENGIRLNLLFMVGYVTETEKDFQQSLDLLSWVSEHPLATIENTLVSCFYTASIIPFTPLFEMAKEMGVTNYESGHYWTYKSNDFSARQARFNRFVEHATSIGLFSVPIRVDHFLPKES